MNAVVSYVVGLVILLQVLHLKQFLWYESPSTLISSATYTLFEHTGHFGAEGESHEARLPPAPPAADGFEPCTVIGRLRWIPRFVLINTNGVRFRFG
jgi:hypothetical protein